MGHLRFGNLAYVRNIIYVRISPYEQKAFPNYLKNSFLGFKRDFNNVAPYAVPPFLLAYMVYCWGNSENARLNRKDPKLYENDK